jgi:hypothetical protein
MPLASPGQKRYPTRVRVTIALLAAAAATIGASFASAGRAPTYSVSFTGGGSEHHVDQQQNIQDNGTCNSAEHVDVTATVSWTASWLGFTPSAREPLARPAQIGGSSVAGTHVKDACGLPLDQAPDGWVMQATCDDGLVASGSPQLSLARKTATSVVLALAAPPLALPVSAQCPLNVRNDQFAVHLVVPLKKLKALKRHASLSFTVGTAHPGPGDLYVPALNCSQPTKPYEGYRTADSCQDTLSWAGSVKITRA